MERIYNQGFSRVFCCLPRWLQLYRAVYHGFGMGRRNVQPTESGSPLLYCFYLHFCGGGSFSLSLTPKWITYAHVQKRKYGLRVRDKIINILYLYYTAADIIIGPEIFNLPFLFSFVPTVYYIIILYAHRTYTTTTYDTYLCIARYWVAKNKENNV